MSPFFEKLASKKEKPELSEAGRFIRERLDPRIFKVRKDLADQGIEEMYEIGPKKLRVAIRKGGANAYTNMHSKSGKDFIIDLDKDKASAETLLHELGHATGRGGKLLRETSWYPKMVTFGQKKRTLAPALLGSAAGVGTGALGKDEKSLDRAQLALNIGTAASSAAVAPLLFEEGRANVRAIELGKKFGYKARKGKLLKSYGTYLGGRALPIVGAYGVGRAMISRRREALKNKKESK